MKKEQKKRGRRVSKPPRFPVQAEKMSALLAWLIKQKVISNQGDFADVLDVTLKTVSNWATGQTMIDRLVQYAIAHLFDVPETWWSQPGIPLEKVIGKGLGQDETGLPPNFAAYLRQVGDELLHHAKKLEKKPLQRNHENLVQP